MIWRGFKYLSVVAIGLCGIARADDSGGGDTSLITGGELYRLHDYDGARRAFEQAYRADPTSGTLFDLALAELHSGRAVDSVQHFRQYIARADAQTDKADAVRTRWLPVALAHIARLHIQAPPGVELMVDGNRLGFTPLFDLEIDGGSHRVVARRGPWSQETTVVVREGDFTPLRIDGPVAAEVVSIRRPSTASDESRTITEAALMSSAVAAAAVAAGFALESGSATGYERAREADIGLACGLAATVLAAGASVAWFAWPAPAVSDRVIVRAAAQSDAIGAKLVVEGAF
jgi:tetratricopeptide (TPR) repeat protein